MLAVNCVLRLLGNIYFRSQWRREFVFFASEMPQLQQVQRRSHESSLVMLSSASEVNGE